MKKRLGVVLTVIAAALIALLSYSYLGDHSTPTGQPPLVGMNAPAFEQFKQEFNRARGRVRVIALLSPT